MLHQFLTANRSELIARCQSKVAQRPAPRATTREMEYGIPLFLDQLIETLRLETTADPMLSRAVSGESGGGVPTESELGKSAALHGRELLQQGFTIEQVVHDYGDLCQAITDLAVEMCAQIEIDEFRTLNRCLDNGIADAVLAFTTQRDIILAGEHVEASNERFGSFAHELRNHLMTATLVFGAIKSGSVPLGGATSAMLDRSLVNMGNLVDRSLAKIRIEAEIPARLQLFSLAEFIADVNVSASLEAQVRECALTVNPVDPNLAVNADRELLFAAVGNLLQNAFKFTHRHSEVSLRAYTTGDRILIEVEDRCGGLPPDFAEDMFRPFVQGAKDRTGVGLGLSISRKSVEANEGVLNVRDLPGLGCVFTVDLPHHILAIATCA